MAIIKWVDSFEETKNNKLIELNKKCNDTILGRFSSEVDGVIYYFSHDSEAQSNFSTAKLAFMDGTVAQMGGVIPWTAYDSEGNVFRLQLNQSQFNSVFLSKMLHVTNNVAKYRDFLVPLVIDAKTPEEIKSITWDK
ncbi:hypothetical protein J7E81_15425 [Bacillus sp. ISL-18]|uniref:hypothetical protein n=1 Tax=Bacillus sp. ISL-18 TaxID=2819118 RepID=UPI001BEAB257|nr:hypothetical protein [Bacillus sp. ISL-18]MBT2656609.1 hypothetical protein [Bacillus sp. ISL-18]